MSASFYGSVCSLVHKLTDGVRSWSCRTKKLSLSVRNSGIIPVECSIPNALNIKWDSCNLVMIFWLSYVVDDYISAANTKSNSQYGNAKTFWPRLHADLRHVLGRACELIWDRAFQDKPLKFSVVLLLLHTRYEYSSYTFYICNQFCQPAVRVLSPSRVRIPLKKGGFNN